MNKAFVTKLVITLATVAAAVYALAAPYPDFG